MTLPPPLPPPPLPRKPMSSRLPVWGWVLLIGGALVMLAILGAAVTGGWFVYQLVAHPERDPLVSGWIRGNEVVRMRDDAKRTMRVWDPKRRREYELKWEVPGRRFDWIEVKGRVANEFSWRIEKPWEQRGSWQLTLEGGTRQAARGLAESLKARGFRVTPDGLPSGGFSAVSESPAREINASVNGNLLTIRAVEFRADPTWGQTLPEWVPAYPGAKVTPTGTGGSGEVKSAYFDLETADSVEAAKKFYESNVGKGWSWKAKPMGDSGYLLTADEPQEEANRGREWIVMLHRGEGVTTMKLTLNESRW